MMKVFVIGYNFVHRLDYYVKHLHKFQGDPDFLNLELPVHHFNVGLYDIGGLKSAAKFQLQNVI